VTTESNLVLALGALCEADPPEITGQGIEESEDRSALASLSDLGALVHVGNVESVLCLACDCPHSVGVEFTGSGQYRAYCPDSGYQQVRPEELRRLAVAEDWIIRAVRSSLGLDQRTISDRAMPSTVARIGRARFGPYACELSFGRRLFEKDRFNEVGRTISGLAGKGPAILLTTTPTDLIQGVPPVRCGIIALEAVLNVTVTTVSLDEGPFHAALRGTDHRFGADGIGFSFSPGFRSAVVGDQEYSFTDKQAQVIEALCAARDSGNPRLHQTEIQGAVDTNQRVGQLFGNNPAYGNLIKHDSSGYYWLDL
jgi:hypothetical protein